MWEKIDCDEPNLSIEDILRLVVLTDGTDYAVRIVKV